jgi:hypothetical protein
MRRFHCDNSICVNNVFWTSSPLPLHSHHPQTPPTLQCLVDLIVHLHTHKHTHTCTHVHTHTHAHTQTHAHVHTHTHTHTHTNTYTRGVLWFSSFFSSLSLLPLPPLASWPPCIYMSHFIIIVILGQGSTNEREHVIFGFLSLAYVTQNDNHQFRLFSWKWPNFIYYFLGSSAYSTAQLLWGELQ